MESGRLVDLTIDFTKYGNLTMKLYALIGYRLYGSLDSHVAFVSVST